MGGLGSAARVSVETGAVPTKGLAKRPAAFVEGCVMFLRHKLRRKDGKQHRYWSIVENRRVSGGRTVQRHALYLGEINDSRVPPWCRTVERSTKAARPANRSRCFPRIAWRHRWSATWCMFGSAACGCAGHANGEAVGGVPPVGPSFNWMSSGRRACRRHGRGHAG